MEQLRKFLRGRFFAATFKTKSKENRKGVFQMLGWDEKNKVIRVRDMALNEIRSFHLNNVKEIRCGDWKFVTPKEF